MKNAFWLLIVVLFTTSCNSTNGEYVDLTTGKKVMLEKDKETGYMVDVDTKKAVYIYVDPTDKDTFYGRTGKRINDNIIRTSNGNYEYDGDNEYVYTSGSYKLKSEADGDYKIKDGDYKKKVEADGDIKIKDGDYKKKISEDGEVKIKDGDTKIKIDKDGNRKVKRD